MNGYNLDTLSNTTYPYELKKWLKRKPKVGVQHDLYNRRDEINNE